VFKENLFTLLGVIHKDHFQWLQNKSIEGVIYEKTNKLLNSNIFINKQVSEDIRIKVKKSLENNKSKKYYFGKNFNISKSENGFIQYQDDQGELILPEPNILGEHQLYNISTSIAASRKIFKVKDDCIKRGIQNIKLKGRLQEIKSGKLKDLAKNNKLIIDGGHNISASLSISNWIKQQDHHVSLIIGMMKDKDHYEFVKAFDGIAKSITLINIPNNEGAILKEELKQKLINIKTSIKLSNSIEESIHSISSSNNNIILCLGSLYLCGEILKLN